MSGHASRPSRPWVARTCLRWRLFAAVREEEELEERDHGLVVHVVQRVHRNLRLFLVFLPGRERLQSKHVVARAGSGVCRFLGSRKRGYQIVGRRIPVIRFLNRSPCVYRFTEGRYNPIISICRNRHVDAVPEFRALVRICRYDDEPCSDEDRRASLHADDACALEKPAAWARRRPDPGWRRRPDPSQQARQAGVLPDHHANIPAISRRW